MMIKEPIPTDEEHYLNSGAKNSWDHEWTFRGYKTDTYTHKTHKYPAMFIPQLARKIILAYSEPGETVLDIFSGSGSTLVESALMGRNAIGIEINPLANLIGRVKTTPVNLYELTKSFQNIKEAFFDPNLDFDNFSFERIDFWFTPSAILGLTKLRTCIFNVPNEQIREFLLVCFSENIRELSVCKHSGFKMHRDPKKITKEYSLEQIFGKFEVSFHKNIGGLEKFVGISSTKKTHTKLIQGSSTKHHKIDSVDLIITSPPYGDSRTTVAYGQFSRLCSQWIGLELDGLDNIGNLDKQLLGGKVQNIALLNAVRSKSLTLNNAINYYESMAGNSALTNTERKKLCSRINDVASFYIDLDQCIKNASNYLKQNKYFVLVTGSRVVKLYKLHTDLICGELAEHYGFIVQSIFYRNIENKRMPRMVSATNIVGEVAPTMTKESILVLKKTGAQGDS